MVKQVGLTQQQVQQALTKYGENKLKEKKELKWLKVLISQFRSPLIYILVIAGGITLALGDIVDASVIAAAVVVNTIFGFYQEMKAERGLRALVKMLTPKAKVIRDGQRQIIDASQVVPGDICVLEIGERVPADGMIIESESLSLDEAILTGEIRSVPKKLRSKAYMGTVVVSGIAKMLVKKTGPSTALGAIAESLKETKEEPTPLQKQLKLLAKKLALAVGVICGTIFLTGWLLGDPLLEIFTTSVAVAVSAIPEGLVVSLTVVLAIGMQRIFKRKALVRKLVAAETLGNVTIICCDKTGTLTEGKMKVVKALTNDEPLLRKAAVLCNDMRDPLETAMMSWGKEKFSGEVKRLDSIPFDPKTKLIATLHPGLLLVSGAPEALLQKCSMTNFQFSNWIKRFDQEANKGYRLVGFAYKKTAKIGFKNLQWLGLLIYDDPIRKGVKETLAAARQAGIKVKMITGDYRATAEAVARQLGIKPENVVSRATPEQKLKIVEVLQSRGEVVAMMGDGVNDAPALKKADIGIVVASASAVSQETADMVLLDSNFGTILAAIEEGRGIFHNLKKIILYLLSDAFAEMILILGSLVCRLPLPVLASQILWVNLIDDGLPNVALTLEPKVKTLMAVKPAGFRRELLDRELKLLSGVISTTAGLMALAIFWIYLKAWGSLELARTMAFTLLAVSTLMYVFSCKDLRKPIWQIDLTDNLFLIASAFFGLGLQMLVLYLPKLQAIFRTAALGLKEWLVVVGLNFILIWVIEAVKWRYNKIRT